MDKELEKLVAEFRERVREAKENPRLQFLDDYEAMIAVSAEQGDYGTAVLHAEMLAEFYVKENPFNRAGEAEKMESIKDSNPELYQAMDACKRALAVGNVAVRLAEYARGLQ